MKAGIVGIGSYLPDKIIANSDLEQIVKTSDKWIRERTGISFRRRSNGICSSDMGAEAAKKALDNAGLTPDDVDLIISTSSSPDKIFPSTACIIQKKINAKNAAAFDIQAACTGFVYAIAIAQSHIISGMYKNILIVSSEALSRMVDWQDRNTCVIFGDGAGAVVLSQVKNGGILNNYLGADGTGDWLLEIPAGGSCEPATYQTVKNRRHYIKMLGSEVFKFAVKILESSVHKVIQTANLTLDDIDYIIPHQANIRIIEAAMKRLKYPLDKVIINLDKYGNMSSASIPVALYEAYKAKKIKKGHKIVMAGFGAGLTWGSTLMEWSL